MEALTEREEIELLELLEAENIDKARNDCVLFIEMFVNIEDKDLLIPILFKLWEGQKRTVNTFILNRLIIVLKARQLGLTWLALAYSAWKMVYCPGYTITALSKREDDSKELTRRMNFIFRHLPASMIVDVKDSVGNKLRTWSGTSFSITVCHPEGEPAIFNSMSASPDSGRSFTSSLVLLDEWAFQEWAKDIWSAAYPTINRPTGGQVIGLSTGKRGTLFEELWNSAEEGLNSFTPVFLDWRTDPRRTKKWFEQTKRDLPHSYRNEYPTNSADAFTVGEGAFFEEWDEDTHVIEYWTPTKDLPIIGSYDAGFASRACFKWYAILPDQDAICFREYYPHRVTDKEQAKEILRLSCYDDDKPRKIVITIDNEKYDIELNGTPYYFQYIVADSDAWTTSRDTGVSTQETFHRFGIKMRQASKNLENGWRTLHEWLKIFKGKDELTTSKLRFTANCHNTRRTYPSCECSKTNPEDIARANEHHCFIAGTMITTIDGKIPIENIKKGDLVLTRKGYYPVCACGMTAKNIEVIKISFTNEQSLTGTKKHPIWINNKWIPLDTVRYCDMILSEDTILEVFKWKLLFTKTKDMLGIQNKKGGLTGYILSIAEKVFANIFIEIFGKSLMEKYQKNIILTIKMIIHLIIKLGIWNVYHVPNTYHIIQKEKNLLKSNMQKCLQVLLNGINQMKVENGTQNMVRKLWQVEKNEKEYVHIVEEKEKQSTGKKGIGSVQIIVNQQTEGNQELTMKNEHVSYVGKNIPAINTVNRKHVQENAVRAKDLCPVGTGTVYNISIYGQHEYFANGILVHNCQDVDRYFVMSRPKNKPKEDEQKKYIVGGKYFINELVARGYKKHEIKLLEKKRVITILGN